VSCESFETFATFRLVPKNLHKMQMMPAAKGKTGWGMEIGGENVEEG